MSFLVPESTYKPLAEPVANLADYVSTEVGTLAEADRKRKEAEEKLRRQQEEAIASVNAFNTQASQFPESVGRGQTLATQGSQRPAQKTGRSIITSGVS